MIGSIIGDIVGSTYEFHNTKKYDFIAFNEKSIYTDDSIMSIATAESLLYNKPFKNKYLEWGRKFPDSGYGGNFRKWLLYTPDPQPYNSWGNGSAMRISPVGFVCNTIEEILEKSKESAECSHNHPEGIKGAQAIASAIFLARNGKSKNEIKSFIEDNFNYDLSFKTEDIRPTYKFDVSCQGSVPQAIVAFLESSSFEDSIRLAVSLGGDSDTIGAMNGGIAQAFYNEIPKEWVEKTIDILPEAILFVIKTFEKKYNINYKII